MQASTCTESKKLIWDFADICTEKDCKKAHAKDDNHDGVQWHLFTGRTVYHITNTADSISFKVHTYYMYSTMSLSFEPIGPCPKDASILHYREDERIRETPKSYLNKYIRYKSTSEDMGELKEACVYLMARLPNMDNIRKIATIIAEYTDLPTLFYYDAIEKGIIIKEMDNVLKQGQYRCKVCSTDPQRSKPQE